MENLEYRMQEQTQYMRVIKRANIKPKVRFNPNHDAKTGQFTAGGGSGGGTVTSVKHYDGTEIDLSDSPLKYGGKDPAVDSRRATVEQWEKKRASAKREYAFAVGADGSISDEYKGGKGGVSMPPESAEEGTIVTHIHPIDSKDGRIGGTFSPADISAFSSKGMSTLRAVALEGTYSMTKTKDFKPELLSYVRKSEKARRDKLISEQNKLYDDYKSGKYDFNEAVRLEKKVINKYLVGCHEDLLNGQEEYGYTYTLERRN